MKATSIKQIKFNRGQVSDLLSERVDMGLQNACGTVYDNMYINRYGQLQNRPSLLDAGKSAIPDFESIICMFDTGTDLVYAIVAASDSVKVYGPLSKSNPYRKIDFSTAKATASITWTGLTTAKHCQIGYNVVFYGQTGKPWLLNLVSSYSDWSGGLTLTIKDSFFTGAFDNVFVRGINEETPDDFTVATSGFYKIGGMASADTGSLITVKRNGAGGSFTQSLVGQVIDSPANGGSLQVKSVEDGDTLYATVLSPFLALKPSDSDILIPWNVRQLRTPSIITPYQYDSAKWIFGYVRPYGDSAHNGNPSYPDSCIYANQRLIFGGNDYWGNLICVSRIGVLNDFDPESSTESDAFSTQIASKDFCRIVNFVVSNNELRIACTNGEYAMSLANLTPTGSLNGFDLRSEVGIEKGTAICDCGGLTAYISSDGNSVYGTQFSLLRDRYQPISLTSQTKNIVNNATKLVYLTNRPNDEGNCLVGYNSNTTMFVGNIDLNAGLIGLTKMKDIGGLYIERQTPYHTLSMSISRLWQVGSSLWATMYQHSPSAPLSEFYLVRFAFGEMFDYPTWYINETDPLGVPLPHGGTLIMPGYLYRRATYVQSRYDKHRALYHNPTTGKYEIIKPTGYTYNSDDGTYTINFDPSIDQSKIICAGFIRQSDWRSVEVGIGMATREVNKQIIKIEGVIEPTQVTGSGNYAGLVLTPEEAKDFIVLTRSKDVEVMDIDNLSNTSYTESQDLVWRRAFDNPSRELHYGVSFVAPFLVKSITATIQYDEVA